MLVYICLNINYLNKRLYYIIDFIIPIEAAPENPHVFMTNGTEAKLLVKQNASIIKSDVFENMFRS